MAELRRSGSVPLCARSGTPPSGVGAGAVGGVSAGKAGSSSENVTPRRSSRAASPDNATGAAPSETDSGRPRSSTGTHSKRSSGDSPQVRHHGFNRKKGRESASPSPSPKATPATPKGKHSASMDPKSDPMKPRRVSFDVPPPTVQSVTVHRENLATLTAVEYAKRFVQHTDERPILGFLRTAASLIPRVPDISIQPMTARSPEVFKKKFADLVATVLSLIAVEVASSDEQNVMLKNGFKIPRSVYDFKVGKKPSMSLQTYMERFEQHTLSDAEVFLLVLIYFDRKWGKVPVTESNMHRLWCGAFVAGSKFYMDSYHGNRHYAMVGGIPASDLASIEMQFLIDHRFSLLVDSSEWRLYFEPFSQLLNLTGTISIEDYFSRLCGAGIDPADVLVSSLSSSFAELSILQPDMVSHAAPPPQEVQSTQKGPLKFSGLRTKSTTRLFGRNQLANPAPAAEPSKQSSPSPQPATPTKEEPKQPQLTSRMSLRRLFARNSAPNLNAAPAQPNQAPQASQLLQPLGTKPGEEPQLPPSPKGHRHKAQSTSKLPIRGASPTNDAAMHPPTPPPLAPAMEAKPKEEAAAKKRHHGTGSDGVVHPPKTRSVKKVPSETKGTAIPPLPDEPTSKK